MGLAGIVAALSLCLVPGVADAAKGKKKNRPVRVLTTNMYLGSDLTEAATAGAGGMFDLFADEVGEINSDRILNNFPGRAKTLAGEIMDNKADLVGLQEVSLFRTDVPTNGGGPPTGTAAFTPVIDYLDRLLAELNADAKTKKECKAAAKKAKAAGKKPKPCYQGYQLVIQQQEADVEGLADLDRNPGPDGINASTPASGAGDDDTGLSVGEPPGDANGDMNPTDCPPGGTGTFPTRVCLFHGIDGDLRLTVFDAILARKGDGVKTSNPRSANYNNVIALPVFGGAVTLRFLRGWESVDVNVRGKRFHLVNTHLESESTGTFREDQAAEMVAPGGPAAVPNTVIIGDLNSDPAGPGDSPIAINRLIGAGFSSRTSSALTFGHGELLFDTTNVIDNNRIDHVMTNNPAITMRSSRVLDTFENGLWGSDHGRVLSILNVPGGKKKGGRKKKR